MAGKLPSALSRLPPAPSLQNQSLLSEIAVTQALATRLRRDRDTWRTLAQRDSKDLDEAKKMLEDREFFISELEQGKTSLKNQCDTSEAANADLTSRLNEATTKRDCLADQLHKSEANITKLHCSDRNKDKMQQQNVHLQALMHRQSAKCASATLRATARNEGILQDAISSAIECIEELEARSQALIDALEQQDASSENSDDEAEYDDRESMTKLLETQFQMRGVLNERGFVLQRRIWQHLMRDWKIFSTVTIGVGEEMDGGLSEVTHLSFLGGESRANVILG